MNSFSIVLLSNVGATGAGAAAIWGGGRGAFVIGGTFAGTAATLEYLSPSGAWVAAVTPAGVAVSLTASGMALFEAPPGSMRAVLTGGTPSGIYADAARIPA